MDYQGGIGSAVSCGGENAPFWDFRGEGRRGGEGFGSMGERGQPSSSGGLGSSSLRASSRACVASVRAEWAEPGEATDEAKHLKYLNP